MHTTHQHHENHKHTTPRKLLGGRAFCGFDSCKEQHETVRHNQHSTAGATNSNEHNKKQRTSRQQTNNNGNQTALGWSAPSVRFDSGLHKSKHNVKQKKITQTHTKHSNTATHSNNKHQKAALLRRLHKLRLFLHFFH